MKSSKLIYLIIILLVAAIASFFILRTSEDYEIFKQDIRIINELKLLNNQINEDILKSRASLLLNFDPISNKIKAIRKNEKFLLEESTIIELEDSTIHENLLLFQKGSKEKNRHIEKYKMEYTVLYNSLKSLPVISEELLTSKFLKSPSLKQTLNLLIKEMLIFNDQPEIANKARIHQLIHQLQQGKALVSNAQQNTVALIIGHTNIILDKKERLDKITIDIINSNLDRYLNNIEVRFDMLISQKIARDNQFSYYLYAIIFLLILTVTYSLHRIMRQEREVTTLNHGLEAKVASRTKEILEKNKELEEHTEELLDLYGKVSIQSREIEQQNKNITASINYAQKIQSALLPEKAQLNNAFSDIFILYRPRDIVSGDFYWFTEKENKKVMVVADCTGHGVPGAFMSLIGNVILDRIINQMQIFEPHRILAHLHQEVKHILKQDTTDNKDGMDIAICIIDYDTQNLYFASAKRPLLFIEREQSNLQTIKGDKHSIGGSKYDNIAFSTHTLPLEKVSTFYLFSDGYPDQFGGKDNRKFLMKRFKSILEEIHHLPLQEQEQQLSSILSDWMDNTYKQTDDIIVIGCKV